MKEFAIKIYSKNSKNYVLLEDPVHPRVFDSIEMAKQFAQKWLDSCKKDSLNTEKIEIVSREVSCWRKEA